MATDLTLQDRPIRAYINRSLVGKMPPGTSSSRWAEFHRQWEAVDFTARDLAVEIWQGHSFAALHDGPKTKAHFVEAHHIALDFDCGDERASFDALMADDLVNAYSAFIYATPSSTPVAPRSRVVFIVDRPFQTVEEYEATLQAFRWWYPDSDQSTVDASRLFYGSPKAAVVTQWSILPWQVANEVVRQYQNSRPRVTVAPVKVAVARPADAYLDRVRDRLIGTVAKAADGEKHTTLNKVAYTMGGYIAGGYFNEGDARAWLQEAVQQLPNVKNVEAAFKTIDDALAAGRGVPLTVERPRRFGERSHA